MIYEPDPRALERALEARYVADDPESPWWRILADLHPKQRAVLEDPAYEKCLEKGRRAGGSWVVAAWLLEEWHRWPGHTSMFVALTKEHAKSILWPTLLQMDAKYSLGIHFNGLDLSATLPNGYKIILRAAKDRAQVEKLRGIAGGLRRACVDEAGSFGRHDEQFRYLLESVISPQFMDTEHLGGGQLILCGSPGMDPMGFYYERCSGLNHLGDPVLKWSTHHWTALDNPHLDARAYLLRKLPGHITDETPAAEMLAEIVALHEVPLTDARWAHTLSRLSASFRREYLADWVKDVDALVYVPTERNLLPVGYTLPTDRAWRIVIGCDVGWGDGNGFCVAAKCLQSRDIIVLRAYYLPEMDDSQIADELKQLRTDWRASEIYVDCGGEGDRLIANLENHGVLAQAAGKGRKKPRIEYVRALLKIGALKLRPEHCAAVLSEWSSLPWSEDKQLHREGFVDDVADALLMAVNPLSQRFLPAAPARPKPGDPGFERHQEELEKAATLRQGRRIVRRRTRSLVSLPVWSDVPLEEDLPLAA
jgi:hypothetical protein